MRSVRLRSQILLIVLGAAVLPLGIVGLWLTASAVRSGEALLFDHLEASADQLVAVINGRWERRRGDVDLIAGNEATLRAVTMDSLLPTDRAYLDQLGLGLERTVPTIELRDVADAVRWRSTPGTRASAVRTRPGEGVTLPAGGPTIRVRRDIRERERVVGIAVMEVALEAVVPGDLARPLVPGGRVAVRATDAPSPLIALDPRLPFPSGSRVEFGKEPWLVAQRKLQEPSIDIAVSAPLAPYVSRFEEAGRLGVVLLLCLTLLAVGLTALLAARSTRPLEELAAASQAVTRGDMTSRVGVRGPTEVRDVAQGFNVMTEHLRQTLEQLAQRSALAAVGEFATSLSHDVRNALTAIKVDLDRAARREIPDGVTETLVHRARNNVARLESVVTGALQVARSGSAPLVETDLRSPIRGAAEAVAGTFASVPAILDLELPDAPVLVRGDAAALQQLFANLLFNAAQAMTPGGAANLSVRLRASEVDVVIADSGSGMDDATMARLRGASYSSKPNGTGLGLPIARQIVAGHGGTIAVESAQGRGTTVTVSLPRWNTAFMPIGQTVQGIAITDQGPATVNR